ncbi:MAG: F0F1 ATP synthase subunit gamma [Gammaproteobacteria bacterium]|jgi:F-type H+-transporting ATPase subunit gamma|nr:F0F1 ATP synthase subunit gamma [Chromatiales bacterium]MDP6674351.1 F0F1 ATP synthase subunit gamma [Gammaproteobacteria bacterium]
MANLKEIRTKIGSVKNTQKITKAMEMVAASKMRRTQQRMQETRPYADKIRTVIGHLYQANPEYRHPFLVEREIKRVGYIVVTTDRGLCGGLNVNTFRALLKDLKEWRDKDIEVDLCLIGAKGVQFFRSLNVNVVGAATHLGEDPKVADLVGSIKIMLNAYSEGRIDRLYLMHSEFVNTMSQKPDIKTLIPVEAIDAGDLPQHWDYIYEPDAVELLDTVLMRYIESQVYRATIENVACEMASKMVAMKSATDNAIKFIDQLQLDYNKARQAAITQEISEIVGGAAAV